MEMCSPLDLAELAASSRRLRTLIEAHPHVWRRVQSNFARGVCPGLPSYANSLEATANCSQAAYARWIFGGGFCTWCKRQADAIPFNFHLDFRACSTKCERALSSGGLLFIDTSGKYDKHPWGKWLARFKYEPQWGDFFLYSTAALKDAVGELKQAIDVTQGRIPSGQPTAFPRCTLHELIRKHVYRELSRPALSQVNARS
ncbi:hypothetical protein C8F01DRAFT_325865 [Mycena amicta]|nr:hypothetical protein C8F01DRAFT_325865 [Mycena amicta]